jgi:hypothetical protein
MTKECLMTPENEPLSKRTAAAVALLKPVAKEVTAAAESLAKPILALDAALQGMHLAHEAWVTYRSQSDEVEYTNWDLGYTRIGNRWGIAIRTINGRESEPERSRTDKWHFNESPLYLRHAAIDKLPDLLEALAKTGTTVAGKLTRAAVRASEIAEAISPSAKASR